MANNKCHDCHNYQENHYTTGLFECCSNGCEKDIRADERAKVIKEFYDMSADALLWLLHGYGTDLYAEVGNTLRNVKETMEENNNAM